MYFSDKNFKLNYKNIVKINATWSSCQAVYNKIEKWLLDKSILFNKFLKSSLFWVVQVLSEFEERVKELVIHENKSWSMALEQREIR